MSTQNEKLGQKDSCQFYCKQVEETGLCPEVGTGAGPLTTTDGSEDGSLLRFCWLKNQARRQERQHLEQGYKHRQGPWINMDL